MLCLATAVHNVKLWTAVASLRFAKYKSQHICVFQDWKHILLLTTVHTGASQNTECQYLSPQLASSACFSVISPSIISRFSRNFVKIIFQQNAYISENFVKLYSLFQKLDHLTCGKFKLRRPYLNLLN